MLYQQNSIVPLEAALVGNFGNAVKSSKERSLKKKIDSQMIVEYGAYGKRPTASTLLGNVQLSLFNTLSNITFQESLLDLGWCLRMCPKEIFDVYLMILTSTLSIFHTFPATYHLALLMVCTFHSSLDMHDAAHTLMISDIATGAWLIDFCHKAI